MKIRLILTALSALLWLTAGAVWAGEEERFETTASLGSGGVVVVDANNGSITVDVWNRDEVRIVAVKKAQGGDAAEMLRETEIEVEESNGRVSIRAIEAEAKGWFGSRGGVSVSFEITVPADAELRAETTNGAVKVSELGGAAEVRTQNGSLQLDGVSGAVKAHTVNGSIKAYGVRGAVEAETTNGSIKAEMDVMDLSRDVRMTTTNGSVELRINPGMSASIDARTSNGSVKTDFRDAVVSERKKSLDLKLGGGGPRIQLRSTNGSVRVLEL